MVPAKRGNESQIRSSKTEEDSGRKHNYPGSQKPKYGIHNTQPF